MRIKNLWLLVSIAPYVMIGTAKGVFAAADENHVGGSSIFYDSGQTYDIAAGDLDDDDDIDVVMGKNAINEVWLNNSSDFFR